MAKSEGVEGGFAIVRGAAADESGGRETNEGCYKLDAL